MGVHAVRRSRDYNLLHRIQIFHCSSRGDEPEHPLPVVMAPRVHLLSHDRLELLLVLVRQRWSDSLTEAKKGVTTCLRHSELVTNDRIQLQQIFEADWASLGHDVKILDVPWIGVGSWED